MKSLDIETIQNESMLSSLPEVEIDSRLKDPAKIEAAIAAAKTKQIEKMALSPFYGRICAFAISGEGQNMFRVIGASEDKAESDLISFLLNQLIVGKETTNAVMTWNGMQFDFPFIYKRAAILGIELPLNCQPLSFWTKKYSHEPHCDLMQELAGWNREQYTNLDEAAKLFLGERKTERDYSRYAQMIKDGEGEEIGKDCLSDAILTHRIGTKISHYLF